MFIHRSNCVDQFKEEIKAAGKDDIIEIMTYQRLEHGKIKQMDICDLSKYKYLICDEFHYFFNDSSFNNRTAISFELIIQQTDAVKLFMSATGEDMKNYMNKYIMEHNLPEIIEYDIPKDFSFIKSLTFYNHDSSLENIFIKSAIERGEKAIIFLQSAEKAYSLYRKYKKYCVFNCGSSSKYYTYVDAEKIRRILINQKFDELVLITTACFDAGINIIDLELKHIIVDITDIGSLIQCMGRKRIQNEEDKVHIYIKCINNKRLSGLRQSMKKQVEMADYFIENNYSIQKLIEKYPRTNDKTDIIFDDFITNETGKKYYAKRINDIMYWKKKIDIALFSVMLERYKDFGYCKYLAKLFGLYNDDTGRYQYRLIMEDDSMESYMKDKVGTVMLQRKDRQELIKKINAKSGGKLLHKLPTLNEALEKRGINYRIVEFETIRVIENTDKVTGEVKKVKKKYKNAWKIVAVDMDNSDTL